jgi:intraflagellar transport protein 140
VKSVDFRVSTNPNFPSRSNINMVMFMQEYKARLNAGASTKRSLTSPFGDHKGMPNYDDIDANANHDMDATDSTDSMAVSMHDVLSSAWSSGRESQPVLAVSLSDGTIPMFGEEGDPIKMEQPISRSLQRCEHMAWHSSHTWMAAGWNDGVVSLWTERDRILTNEFTAHESAITLVQWSPVGKYLVTGDKSGVLCVWMVSTQGKLKLKCRYARQGAITHCVFCIEPETADSNRRDDAKNSPQRIASNSKGPSCPPFYFGSSAGVLHSADDAGHCSEVMQCAAPITTMSFDCHSRRLSFVTEDVCLHRYAIAPNGTLDSSPSMKLSIKGDGSNFRPVWAGPDIMIASNNERLLRVWYTSSNDSFTLPLQSAYRHADPNDAFVCAAFDARKQVLAAGTTQGVVCMWRHTAAAKRLKDGDSKNAADTEPSREDWEPMPPMLVSDGVQSLCWSPMGGSLAVRMQRATSVLSEGKLYCNIKHDKQVMQVSSQRLLVRNDEDSTSQTIDTSIRIKGADVSESHLAVWSGTHVETYAWDPDVQEFKFVAKYERRVSDAALCGSFLYSCTNDQLQVSNAFGTDTKKLNWTDMRGRPSLMSIHSGFMAVASNANMIKLWQFTTGSQQPKVIVPGRQIDEVDCITDVQVNAEGSKISLLSTVHDSVSGMSMCDTRLFVYDVELDRVFSHDFGPFYFPATQRWDHDDVKLMVVETRWLDAPSATATTEKSSSSDDIAGDGADIQIEIYGDSGADIDAKFDNDTTTADNKLNLSPPKAADSASPAGAETELTVMFVTSEYGICMQDSVSLNHGSEWLMGVRVPHIILMTWPSPAALVRTQKTLYGPRMGGQDTRGSMHAAFLPRAKRRTMRDFVGLERIDDATKRDLLSFSFFVTVGHMDEAYQAVKKIQNANIWSNMARMCVKTKRLDVAQVCLGNMADARAARAVREAMDKLPEHEAKVATLAIELGMLSDAERLLSSCHRYDLLVKLLVDQSKWKEAIHTARAHNRMDLRSVHYKYGRHLETCGQIKEAIEAYEKSDMHHSEVPRMLLKLNRLDELRNYISTKDSARLNKWWAQYLESNGASDASLYEQAFQHYDKAKARFEQVRVLCTAQQYDQAAKVCADTKDRAACFYLAREYENAGMAEEAVRSYSQAERFNHAVRVARQHHMDADLMKLALQSSNSCKLSTARYYERKQSYDKAVLLYQRGGNVGRALQLCFQAQLFDSLRNIADDLGDDTDPELLAQCGEFFMQHQQYGKAAHMLVSAGQAGKALELCMEHRVDISEDLAERMTPPKPATTQERKQRSEVLVKLATCLRNQGAYHLACKKFTQAGDKVRAMQCLLKSNDTEKIVYYASMTRKREIYILAANYLQNLDWRNQPSVMKNIITFYTKAKAYDRLSLFYDACSQLEINEFRDYAKALGALQEAMKYAIKAAGAPNREERLRELDDRMQIIGRFVEARQCADTEPDKMLQMCSELTAEPEIEHAMRVGDVYAVMIEHYYAHQAHADAYRLLMDMLQSGNMITPFIDQVIVRDVLAAVGQLNQLAAMLGQQPLSERQQQSQSHSQQQYDTESGFEAQQQDDFVDYAADGIAQ